MANSLVYVHWNCWETEQTTERKYGWDGELYSYDCRKEKLERKKKDNKLIHRVDDYHYYYLHIQSAYNDETFTDVYSF